MESLTVTTPASTLPISVADLKMHLRITHSNDDDYIEDLAWVAYAWIEQEADVTINQTVYTWKLAKFDSFLVLPKPPCVSVDSFTIYNSDNSSQSLVQNTDYYLVTATRHASFLKPVTTWPSVYDRPDAINIVYTAYMSPVFHQVVHLMRLLVSNAYEFREGEITLRTNALKLGVDRLLNQIRHARYR